MSLSAQDKQKYIDSLAPSAIDAQSIAGTPASITLAQAILEGNWGRSKLASLYNNLFGIKGSGVALPTTEVENGVTIHTTASFRAYNSVSDSIADHAKLLAGDRYQKQVAGISDPVEYAKGLKAAGYATDPLYAEKLIGIIKDYNLTKYDSGGGSVGTSIHSTEKAERDKTWWDYVKEGWTSVKTGDYSTALPGDPEAKRNNATTPDDETNRFYLLHGNSFVPDIYFSKTGMMQVGLFLVGAIFLFVFLKGQATGPQTVVIEK